MLDLKYCTQYLMMKALSQRNRKAALKALDQHISDCDAYVSRFDYDSVAILIVE